METMWAHNWVLTGQVGNCLSINSENYCSVLRLSVLLFSLTTYLLPFCLLFWQNFVFYRGEASTKPLVWTQQVGPPCWRACSPACSCHAWPRRGTTRSRRSSQKTYASAICAKTWTSTWTPTSGCLRRCSSNLYTRRATCLWWGWRPTRGRSSPPTTGLTGRSSALGSSLRNAATMKLKWLCCLTRSSD